MTFTITPEQYAALKTKLEAEPNVVFTDNGNLCALNYHGVALACAFDGAASLTVNILHSPYPDFIVEHQVKGMFNSFING
jgi:hypothetical protein